MDRNKLKSDTLQKLIDMMDSKMVDGLKEKSPKFMKVETNDPEMAEEVVEQAVDSEMPEETSLPDESEDSEDLARLMELYKQLK